MTLFLSSCFLLRPTLHQIIIHGGSDTRFAYILLSRSVCLCAFFSSLFCVISSFHEQIAINVGSWSNLHSDVLIRTCFHVVPSLFFCCCFIFALFSTVFSCLFLCRLSLDPCWRENWLAGEAIVWPRFDFVSFILERCSIGLSVLTDWQHIEHKRCLAGTCTNNTNQSFSFALSPFYFLLWTSTQHNSYRNATFLFFFIHKNKALLS